MRLGLQYTTRVPAKQVLKTIRTEAEKMGYSLEEIPTSESCCVAIRARFVSPRSCIWGLLRQLPMDVYWEVRQDGEQTAIYCDSRVTGPHLWATLLAFAGFTVCYLRGTGIVRADWSTAPGAELSVDAMFFLAGWALLAVSVSLVFAGGMTRLRAITDQVRLAAIRMGSSLEEEGVGTSLRQIIRAVSCLVSVCCVLVVPLLGSLPGPSDWRGMPRAIVVTGALLVCLVVVLILSLFPIALSPGFGLRLYPGISGLYTAVGCLFLFAAQAPWHTLDGNLPANSADVWTSMRAASTMPRAGPAETSPARRERRQAALSRVTFTARAAWSTTLIFLALAVLLSLMAIDSALKAYPHLHQLSKRPERGWSQRATQGHGPMARFRIVFGAAWLLLGSCLLLTGAPTVTTASYLLREQDTTTPGAKLNAVETSALFASIAIGDSTHASTTRKLVHGFWAVYVLACGLLASLSIGSFCVQQLMRRSRPDRGRTPSWGLLQSRVSALWQRQHSSRPCPSLILTDEPAPRPRARRAGLLCLRQTEVEMTAGCLELLAEDELEAVLAHELGHCLARHCLLDDLARLAGRCTLIGDGFVRTLEDTFGYEETADRLAVEAFGARPAALVRALWKLHNTEAVIALQPIGLGLDTAEPPEPAEVRDAFSFGRLGWRRRSALALRLYLEQYLGAGQSSYWHPSVAHRASLLTQMQEREQPTPPLPPPDRRNPGHTPAPY